jgi:drug/metabolite transporter (DMT)-like permease
VTARGGTRAAVAAMVVATLLWGGTFVAIRDSVRVLSPAALVFGRFAVAAVLFILIAIVRRRVPGRGSIIVGAGNGALMAGSFFLQATGLRLTSAGSSAFLTCAGTLFAAFYAWALLRQRPAPSLLAGIALALAGSALMSLDGALHLGRGELITLAGASLYALQIVWIARHYESLEPLSLVTVQVIVVALLLAPFAGDVRAAYGALHGVGWLQFAYLAVAGSSIAPLLQVQAQRRLSPGRVGLLFALEPVFALLFALTLGEERFALRWWAGAGLILAAVLLVEWRAATQERTAA